MKSIYIVILLALGAFWSHLTLNAAPSLTPSLEASPKAEPAALYLLRSSAKDNKISLRQALSLAKQRNMAVLSSQEQTKQSESGFRGALSHILPRLSVSGQYTRNVPEVSINMAQDSSNGINALVQEQVATLLERTMTDPSESEIAALNAQHLRAAAQASRNPPSRAITIMPAELFESTLTLRMPLWNPLILSTLQNSALLLKQSQVREESVFDSSSLQVAIAYYNALNALNQTKVAKAFEERCLHYNTRQKAKAQEGLSRQLDLQRTELDLLRASERYKQAQLRYNLALGNLGLLIGEEESFELMQPRPLSAFEQGKSEEQLQREALENRHDLRLQRFSVQMSTNQRSASYMDFLPRLDLGMQGRYTTNTGGFNSNPWNFAFYLTASLDLFDGGEKVAAAQKAASILRESSIKLNQLHKQIEAEIRGNLEQIAIQKSSLENAEKALLYAKDMLKNAEELHHAGLASSSELSDTNYALFQAQAEEQNTRWQLEQSRLSLAAAAGHLQNLLANSI